MMFDEKALETVNNLVKLTGKQYIQKPSLICPQYITIGAEIEVKFRYMFPEIFERYFKDRKWFEYDENDKEMISNEIKLAETYILPTLEKTIAAGIPRGFDKYWEFAFNPVNNLTLLAYQVEILQASTLIPRGEHSLHISFGNVELNQDFYHILMILQLLYCNKDRMKSGLSDDQQSSKTWAKKGRAGIYRKNQYDLIDSEKGFEFRTLTINQETNIYQLFTTLHFLLENPAETKNIKESVIKKMKSVGLPDKNWENPHQRKEIWKTYFDNFDDLKNHTQQLLKIRA